MAAITEIYAHYVLTSMASFELEPPGVEEMARRRATLLADGLPYLVAEQSDGGLLGYAYAGRYRPRPAYRGTVEDSVYLRSDCRRQGVGRQLLAALLSDCEARGFRQVVAVISDGPESASVRLHERLGFEPAGVLRSVGFKFGRWADTILLQRALGPGDTTPPAGPAP